MKPFEMNNYIGGQWKPARSGKTEPSINPADIDDIVGYIPVSEIEDLNQAVVSAQSAQKKWKLEAAPARGEWLYKVATIIESRMDEIASCMTREMGKTFMEAKGETTRGVAILRYYASEGMRKIGDVIPASDNEAFMFTTRVPLGVVGMITPWNFPVATPLWKIAPALVYGNTVIFKPAFETSVTAGKLIECFAEAGLPDGVINLVIGQGSVIGQGIIEHPQIDGISFTGSDQNGKHVGQGAFARGAKFQLEMGGKNPIIVAEDADLEQAADAAISGGLRTTGQKCTATSRIIVHHSVYESFKSILLSKLEAITIGNGMDVSSWMGPCANEKQLQTVLNYIEKGKAEGATLIHGGVRATGAGLDRGYYVQPTVFEHVEPQMTIAQEEIFGPVLCLMQSNSLEEALAIANDVKYGLSASIFTANIHHMLSFIKHMDAGLVRINAETAGVELQAPFGGMKESSSHSREQGQAAIEFFTSIKTVYVKSNWS